MTDTVRATGWERTRQSLRIMMCSGLAWRILPMLPPRARNSTKIDLTHEIRNSSWDKEKVMQNKERN